MAWLWLFGLTGLALAAKADYRAPSLKMSCSQLVLDRIDP